MNVLDLFSGIGGFSLGLERAGMRTVAFCEIEPFCQAVLRKHWPGVPIFDDVRKLTASDLSEPIDVICGGYPCQPFSEAGKRRGSADDRHLWPEYRRLVEELRPTWVLAENVVGHVSLGIDDVLTDLETLGYACQPFVIPACAADARHQRARLWIVAHAESIGRDHGDDSELQRPGAREVHAPSSAGSHSGELEARRWEDEPAVGRVAHGVPNRVDRLKALGNAVVPQIPEIIGRAIMKAEAA